MDPMNNEWQVIGRKEVETKTLPLEIIIEEDVEEKGFNDVEQKNSRKRDRSLSPGCFKPMEYENIKPPKRRRIYQSHRYQQLNNRVLTEHEIKRLCVGCLLFMFVVLLYSIYLVMERLKENSADINSPLGNFTNNGNEHRIIPGDFPI